MTTPINLGGLAVPQIWLAVGAAFLAALLVTAIIRSRRNRQVTVREMRRRDAKQLKKEHHDGVVRATAYAIFVDALTACQGKLARLKALEESIAHDEGQIERITRRHKLRNDQSDEQLAALKVKHEDAVRACEGQKSPEMKHRHASAWSWLLLAGDLYIVQNVILVGHPHISQLAALAMAAAIGLALWLLGRKAGTEFRRYRGAPRFAVAILVLLLAVSGALFLLRIEQEIAWLVLAVCPAIGTAITKMLGPTAQQRKAHELEKEICNIETEAKARETGANREMEKLHLAIKKSAVEHSEKRESVQCGLTIAAGKVKALLVGHDLDARQDDFVQIITEVGLGEYLATHEVERLLVDLTVPRDQKYLDLTTAAARSDRSRTSVDTTPRAPSANGIHPLHEVSA